MVQPPTSKPTAIPPSIQRHRVPQLAKPEVCERTQGVWSDWCRALAAGGGVRPKKRDSDSKMEVVFAREEDVHPHIFEHIHVYIYITMGVLLLMWCFCMFLKYKDVFIPWTCSFMSASCVFWLPRGWTSQNLIQQTYLVIYSVVKVDGTTAKRWFSKGPWWTNRWELRHLLSRW